MTTICNGDISLAQIRSETNAKCRKTKIICTLGPSCWSVEGLLGLIDAGMNIARLNFSHGDFNTHGGCVTRLREALAQRPGKHVAIMLDTKGPEIRTGVVDPSLGGKLKLVKNELIEIGTDYSRPCTPQYLACSYASLPTTVVPGSRILCADGALSLTVVECKEKSVIARIMNNASFGDKKNMNLPGAVVDLPTLTPKDIDDIVNFGIPNNIDFIAASFVRKAADIDKIREVCGENGRNIKIIAKIENQEGLENYDDILNRTDAIMVARGDLGMEIPIEKVFLAQKMMIHKANVVGKPIVTATQMLESMITNPRPTRAECADVANAVLDGSDCVMLSGETANGEYPNDAVRMMANTCIEAENLINYDSTFEKVRQAHLEKFGQMSAEESLASSAVKTAWDVRASAIIMITSAGNCVRAVSKYRPAVPTFALTAEPWVARQCQGYMKNVHSKVVETAKIPPENLIVSALAEIQGEGWVKSGDKVVVMYRPADALSRGAPSDFNIRIVVV